MLITMGRYLWGICKDTYKTWVDDYKSYRSTKKNNKSKFSKSTIVSIVNVGVEPTFGITINNSHSYVSDGVVVHNTIPKHTIWAKPLRSVYKPPPGHVILNADYSQGELRIAACIANEPNMIQAYRNGIDMHLVTGCEVFGLDMDKALALKAAGDDQIKIIRQGGKAGNFGLIYGMGAPGFTIYAKRSYGVDLSLQESTTFRDKFFNTRPQLIVWHEKSIDTAQKHRMIRTPLGRLRHLPSINSQDNELRAKQERQAINSPVQATLSDLGLWAMAILYKKYPQLWVFGFTHDALSFYIPEDEVDIWAKRIKHVMENLPLHKLGWKPQLKFLVDVEVSTDSLATLEEYPMPIT